ncbi:hypothetical protein [Phenylobacterium sp.]|uniref:T4SS efffector SepA family protein n=1 Tax=Phenylobacterium sp. TaxID=1871053 RepID=UPI00301D3800
MPLIEISEEVLAELGAHAEPFVDITPEAVIRKLLAKHPAITAPKIQVLSRYLASAAPNLTFTRVTEVKLGNEILPAEDTYWNNTVRALLRQAASRGCTAEEVCNRIGINAVAGEKTKDGYRFVAEADISFQQQDANGAWKAIRNLAQYLGLSVEVTFEWLNNPKAANPGAAATLVA